MSPGSPSHSTIGHLIFGHSNDTEDSPADYDALANVSNDTATGEDIDTAGNTRRQSMYVELFEGVPPYPPVLALYR